MLIVNDLAGDADGLFAAAHALLSPSMDVRGIVGTGRGHATGMARETPTDAAVKAAELLHVMGLTDRIAVAEGCATPLPNRTTPVRSSGVRMIIDEAMRTDSDLPLYVTIGGGLTELASALLIKPRIASRMTLVWIGGSPPVAGRPAVAMPGSGIECNLSIDVIAGQIVFDTADLAIWQVTTDAVGMTQVSLAELSARAADKGPLGAWLCRQLASLLQSMSDRARLVPGETYMLGDSVLVLLTALTGWAPSSTRPFTFRLTNSSHYTERPTPGIADDGGYTPARSGSRTMRVYDSIDMRMLMEDFYAKLERFAR